MIEIISNDTLYTYNLYHITKAFLPGSDIKQKVDEEQESLVRVKLEGGSCFSIEKDEVKLCNTRQEKKAYVTKRIYEILKEETGRTLAWGTLTGVRPTKLIMQKMEAGLSEEETEAFLREEHYVSEEKISLGIDIAKREKSLLERLDYKDGYSLYIGIPFCPSICSYCSFSSSPVHEWKDKMDMYLDALCKEVSAVAINMKHKKLNTIYIGGGTPTTLSAGQLDRLLGLVCSEFDFSDLIEFTVEAGRPDSITRKKLEVISSYPVTRISVNPQTMQQKTLDAVGRRHTVEDIYNVFNMARELGFDNINMDLIAGLPGENEDDMKDTLSKIESLHPDSLTVHALAIKRTARLNKENYEVDMNSCITTMVDDAAHSACKMGLKPYYLYRQKNIAGNFENVGYAEVDKAGIYNILIMEEKQTIIATGAGSCTKVVLPCKEIMSNGKLSNIVRIENVHNIMEYIERIDEMIDRKGEVLWQR